MTKDDILKLVREYTPTTARNSMGCFENWYSPYYAMKMAFGMEALEEMGEAELNNLVRLAETIGDGLY
jgi:hypothetical protein